MEMSRNERFPPGKILIQNLGLVYLGFCVGLAARSPGWTVGVTTVVHTVQVCTRYRWKTCYLLLGRHIGSSIGYITNSECLHKACTQHYIVHIFTNVCTEQFHLCTVNSTYGCHNLNVFIEMSVNSFRVNQYCKQDRVKL